MTDYCHAALSHPMTLVLRWTMLSRIVLFNTLFFQMMELLKEQLFQKQVAATEEEDEEEEEEEWDDRRRGVYRPRGFPRSYSSGSWAELPRTPRLRRPYSSSTSHLPISPAASDSSYEQVRKLVLWIQMLAPVENLQRMCFRKVLASTYSSQRHVYL